MGGVCTVVETVLAAGFVAQGISEAVLKAKIQGILNEHREEFQLMDSLYVFVEKLMEQGGLTSQLVSTSLFGTANWTAIVDDLEDKCELLAKIKDKFPNINQPGFGFSASQGFMLSISIAAFGYLAFNVASGNIKAELSQNFDDIKKFTKKMVDGAREKCPKFKGSNAPEGGSIDFQSHGSNPEKLPPKTRQLEIEKIKKKEKQGFKSKAVLGFRIVMIGVAVYGFVMGIIGLVELGKQLDKYKEYFGSGGEFEQGEDGVIQLMKAVASDLFNMANAARAALYDCKNMFYTKSILLANYADKVIEYANKIKPEQMGINDDLISATETLALDCNTIFESNASRKQKLKAYNDKFKPYFDKYKPHDTFREVAVLLSQITGPFSLISDQINDEQHNVTRFLRKVAEQFEDERQTNKFPTLSPEQKKEIDTELIEFILEKYTSIFDLPDMEMSNIDQNIKSIVFTAVISFAEDFFYDDLTGQTLFGKSIKDSKTTPNYGDLLNQDLESKSNIVPVWKSDPEEQKTERQKWVDLAKAKNATDNVFPQDGQVKPEIRYLWLATEKWISPVDQSEVTTIQTYEGLRFEVSSKLYKFERKITDGSTKLELILG